MTTEALAMEKENQPGGQTGQIDVQDDHTSGSTATPQDPATAEKALDQVSSDPEVAPPPRNVWGVSWVALVVAVLSTIFLFALDNTITADLQPTIVTRFDAVDRLAWISVAYLLGAAALTLTWSQLYAQMNTKWTYISFVIIFEAGSALCGAAPNMTAFIIGRCICGFSGTGIYIGVMNILAQMTYDHEKAMYFGLCAVTWGTGTVLGPIIGGALADANAWRWAFYLNLFVGIVVGPIYVLLIPANDPRPGATFIERLKPIDYIGSTLMGGSLCSLFMAMAFGGVLFPWNSARIIALFVVAGVLAILFFIQQIYVIGTTVENRVFPMHFLKSKIMVSLALSIAASTAGSFIIIYFIPLLYQLARGSSAIAAGVKLLPYICLMVVSCVGNGILVGRAGIFAYYQPWFIVSGVLLAVSSGLFYTVTESTADAKIYGFSILYGAGVGAAIQLPFSVASAKAKPSEASLAIGFCSCFQFLGPAVALSVANAVFLHDAVENLKNVFPGQSDDVLLAALAGIGHLLDDATGASAAMVHSAVSDAMQSVWIVPISSGCLVFFLGCAMKFEKVFGGQAVGGA